MIVEDYVSFETAKLLKEKGFDEPCHCLWNNPHGTPYNSIDCMMTTYEDIDPEVVHHWYLCPTLQMAIKWLREKHLIFFDIFHIIGDIEDGEEFQIGVYEKTSTDTYTWKNWIKGETYEKTYEKAIQYCLENLI